MFSGADLVVTGTFGQQARTALLRRQGFNVETLEPWRSLAHGREQIMSLAKRLGHADRGESVIAEIDDALARSANIVPPGRSILDYYRRGWVPASDSLVGEILRHMGFVLHQDALGLKRGGVVRLETIVSSPPDFLLLDEDPRARSTMDRRCSRIRRWRRRSRPKGAFSSPAPCRSAAAHRRLPSSTHWRRRFAQKFDD